MAAAKKKAVKKTAKAAKITTTRNLVPLYILIIMALATALVMMINMQGGNKFTETKTPQNSAEKKSGIAEKTAEHTDAVPAPDEPVAAEKKKVKIFFLTYNERTKKVSPGSVMREVSANDVLSAAVNELIKGLSSAEEKKGLINAMPEGMKLRSATVKNGIAEFDFSSEFSENAHGDILTGRINQIFNTALQFPGVKGITIKINGKPVRTVGGDGLILSWPLMKEL